jgi:AcrR family transcriptional regulator
MPDPEGTRRSPRSYAAAAGGPGRLDIPVRDPFATLPATAQRVLEAARKILVERGYESLTLDNIRRESGENGSAVSYYFGGKAGLVEAIVDATFYDECARFVESIPQEERVQRLLEGMQDLSTNFEAFVVYFELFPHALRERLLHDRLVALYQWYINVQLEWIESSAQGFERLDRDAALGLASVISAVIDGLGLQATIDPKHFDVRRSYAVFEAMLRAYLNVVAPPTSTATT